MLERFFVCQSPKGAGCKGDRQKKTEDIRHGLADLYPKESEQYRQNKDCRNKHKSLSGCGQDQGLSRLADILEHHVGYHRDGRQRQGSALEPKRQDSHLEHLRVIAKQPDKFLRKDACSNRIDEQPPKPHFYGEPERLMDSIIKAGGIEKAATG